MKIVYLTDHPEHRKTTRHLSIQAWQFFRAHPILTIAATVAAAGVAAYVAGQMRIGRP